MIRGGYGIFYEVEGSGNRVNHNMVPYTLSETVFNDGLRTMANFFVGRPIGGATTAPSLTGGYPNMPMGYDQHWSFGFQRQLPGQSVLEVNYVGNHGVNLYEGNPINDPLAGRRRDSGSPSLSDLRRNHLQRPGQFHDLSRPASQVRKARLRRPVVSGLLHLVEEHQRRQHARRWAATTLTSAALSSFDIPQNLTASAGYELPIGKGKKILANPAIDSPTACWAAGKCRASWCSRSGRPFTPTISRDVANTGIGGQRPNRIGSGTLSRSDHRAMVR